MTSLNFGRTVLVAASDGAAFDFEAIVESQGIDIAVTGMVIVFVALALITIAISLLPHILGALAGVLPPETERHGHGPPPHAADSAPSRAVVAAISVALHHRRQSKS